MLVYALLMNQDKSLSYTLKRLQKFHVEIADIQRGLGDLIRYVTVLQVEAAQGSRGLSSKNKNPRKRSLPIFEKVGLYLLQKDSTVSEMVSYFRSKYPENAESPNLNISIYSMFKKHTDVFINNGGVWKVNKKEFEKFTD